MYGVIDKLGVPERGTVLLHVDDLFAVMAWGCWKPGMFADHTRSLLVFVSLCAACWKIVWLYLRRTGMKHPKFFIILQAGPN